MRKQFEVKMSFLVIEMQDCEQFLEIIRDRCTEYGITTGDLGSRTDLAVTYRGHVTPIIRKIWNIDRESISSMMVRISDIFSQGRQNPVADAEKFDIEFQVSTGAALAEPEHCSKLSSREWFNKEMRKGF